MKNLNRQTIQRMNGRRAGSSGGGSSRGADLAGYATEVWVNQNYVSIEFFNQLFNIHGHAADDTSASPTDISVLPNDTESIVDSIETMVGLWTEEYLSALGLNSQGGTGGASALSDLLDVSISSPQNGQVLTYNSTTGKWVNATPASPGGVGTVTSVGVSVPTGFSVSNTPVTSSGTIAISFATGYSLPTDAKQSDWDDALILATAISGNFDNVGNAKAANKLTTYSKTAWGQTYWTSGGVPDSISGTLSNVGDIEMDNGKKIKWKNASSTLLSFITLDSNNAFVLGESTAAQNYTTYLRGYNIVFQSGYTNGSTVDNASLDYNGVFAVKKLKIGNIVIEEDTTNGGIHVVSAGLYADTYISTLGANSQGGGGGGITMSDVWQAMAYTAPSSSSQQIHVSHLAQALSGYATQSWVTSQGYVTSDTKNTAGNADTYASSGSPKLYLIGAASYGGTGSYAMTNVNRMCYIDGNCLYSNGSEVLTSASGLATESWVQAQGYVTSNTKNTAGPTNLLATKLFLIGAVSQAYDYSVTYSNSNCYVGTDNCLYSNGSKVLTSASGLVTTDTDQTISGLKTMSHGLLVQGRVYNSGDDEGIVIGLANNGWAGVIIGSHNGKRSCFYMKNIGGSDDSAPFWRFSTGNNYLDINHPGKSGTIALTSDIPTKVSQLTNDSGFITSYTDTKNTAGNYMTTIKLYFIGTQTLSTDSTSYATTFGNQNCYIYNSEIYSNESKVITENTETKNTVGNFNIGSSTGALNALYLVGTAGYSSSQTSYQASSVNSYCYIGTNNNLYSNNSRVITEHNMRYGISTLSIELNPEGILQGYGGFIDFHFNGSSSDYTSRIIEGSSGVLSINSFMAAGTCCGIGGLNGSYSLYVAGAGYFTGKVYSEGNEVLTSASGLATQSWVQSQGYLTSGDVVTTNTAQTITGAKDFNGKVILAQGARAYSIAIECADDGTPDSSKSGEINRSGGTLHLQYSNAQPVSMCQNILVFSHTSVNSVAVGAMGTNSSRGLYFYTSGSAPIYGSQAWSNISDIRRKDIVTHVNGNVEDIANAPVFDFTWKGDTSLRVMLGTSAQYWQNIFPHAITDFGGTLTMDYGATALAAAVITARRVQNHEDRIRDLENENRELREEIRLLKAA